VACLVNAVIEDGENGDHQVRLHDGRNGYIYTFSDDGKTKVLPPKGADFAMEPGGASGSAFSLRVRGKIAPEGIAQGGLGMNFVDPRATYNASKYLGLSFVARRSAKSASKMRLKIPDASTDPDGKVCTECFNDFGADIELTEVWERYVVPFDFMKQLPGWGAPRPAQIDSARLYSVQFQVDELGAEFDIWVDDLAFIGCEPR
jgi:endoglucanase